MQNPPTNEVAKDTGLYKALSGEGNSSFGTILKVIKALGLKLHVQTAGKENEPLPVK